MESSSKTPVIIGILLVVCAVGYYFYTGSSAPAVPDSSLTLSTSGIPGSDVGSSVLALLSQIKGLNIDASFFKTPMYESLNDFSVTIPPEPVGKESPFEPLPGSNTGSNSSPNPSSTQ